MDASKCIYMYCNIERNIMKNQSGSPDFGIQEKSLYILIKKEEAYNLGVDVSIPP